MRIRSGRRCSIKYLTIVSVCIRVDKHHQRRYEYPYGRTAQHVQTPAVSVLHGRRILAWKKKKTIVKRNDSTGYQKNKLRNAKYAGIHTSTVKYTKKKKLKIKLDIDFAARNDVFDHVRGCVNKSGRYFTNETTKTRVKCPGKIYICIFLHSECINIGLTVMCVY